MVLDGPPGVRKTTAMNVVKKLLFELTDVPMSAESQTKESLTKEWATHTKTLTGLNGAPYQRSDGSPICYTPITILVTELSHFLGMNSASMIDFLTTVYDQTTQGYEVRTKNKGNDRIPGPYVCLLGCTTPAWITARMRDDVISGGFSRRALFVYAPTSGPRVPIPHVSDEQKEAWTRLVCAAKEIQKISGAFTFAPDALAFYTEWYTNLEIPNDITSGYYQSKHIQLFKVAMLVSLSEGRDLVLRLEHMQLAMELLNLTEVDLPKVFAGIGRNELNAVSTKVMEILDQSKGMISKKDLERVMNREATSNEMYEVLKHLRSTDQIIIADLMTKGATNPTTMILTPPIYAELQKKVGTK